MLTRRLPIFPLPLVLFPGAPQLLHIFEPRYRQMLADCRDADGRFGVAFVAPEAAGDAAPGAVGCVAAIRAIRPLPDGRANILTVGEDRYVLREYVACDRLYRVAVVETLTDEPWTDAEVREPAAAVTDGFRRFTAALNALSGLPVGPAEVPDSPDALSFHVAAALEIDPRLKQELLAVRSVPERLRRLDGMLQRLIDEAERRVAVQIHAQRNGRRGPAPPATGEGG